MAGALCVSTVIALAFTLSGPFHRAGLPPPTALPTLTPTATIHPPGWKLYSDVSSGFSFQYPSDWSIYKISTRDIGLLPPGSAPDPKNEYVADIILSVLANPSASDLTTFYTSVSEVDLLKYSSASWFTVNGAPAVKFSEISGLMIPTTIVAIAHGNIVLVISDVGQLHATDDIFDSIVASVR